jgi:hypothetical protein
MRQLPVHYHHERNDHHTSHCQERCSKEKAIDSSNPAFGVKLRVQLYDLEIFVAEIGVFDPLAFWQATLHFLQHNLGTEGNSRGADGKYRYRNNNPDCT